MAGIKANSASVTMGDGATSADNTASGFLTNEQITLSTTGSPAVFSWAIAKPSGATVRSDLSSDSDASPILLPDVEGTYTVTVVADGTTYVLRISAVSTSANTFLGAARMLPLLDTQVPAPASGMTTYYSEGAAGLARKDTSGRSVPEAPGLIGANLTDADATLTVSQGVHRTLPVATLTAARAYTLGTSGATAGDIIEIHRYDVTANAATMVNGGPGAGTLTTFTAAEKRSASARFDGTNWALWERRKLA